MQIKWLMSYILNKKQLNLILIHKKLGKWSKKWIIIWISQLDNLNQ